ncbi:hypothetical protein SeseC_00058 [Streptococcus equi subsp. zooepidemicus ATCC 35246]|nr:hypothetical protein SeseC_00058 [Streptococcus equi subsp. zooepidemicus ATCC 35246]AIA68960.1 hypothetical protein Q426_09075 [Streptococcus equi subsp. zooepidemicus CY]
MQAFQGIFSKKLALEKGKQDCRQTSAVPAILFDLPQIREAISKQSLRRTLHSDDSG